jgi:hypothetical protein
LSGSEKIIDSNKYYQRFKTFSDEDLVNIVYIEPENFENDAVEAAKKEIRIRRIDNNTISNYISFRIDQIIKLQERIEEEKNFKWLNLIFFTIPFGHLIGFFLEALFKKEFGKSLEDK